MSLKIYCRIKPPLAGNVQLKANSVTLKSYSFNFDHIFPENHSQKEVFSCTAEKIIAPALLGQSGSVFIFGPSE